MSDEVQPKATLDSRVTSLEDKVEALSKQRTGGATKNDVRKVQDKLENVLDHVYGVNVRPVARERADDEYPAEVESVNSE